MEQELTVEQRLAFARQVGYKLPYHITNTDNPVDFPTDVVENEVHAGTVLGEISSL